MTLQSEIVRFLGVTATPTIEKLVSTSDKIILNKITFMCTEIKPFKIKILFNKYQNNYLIVLALGVYKSSEFLCSPQPTMPKFVSYILV